MPFFRSSLITIAALCLATDLAPTVQAQSPAPTTVFRRITRQRWMNSRQRPAFTQWEESGLVVQFDSTSNGLNGTTLHFSNQSYATRIPLSVEVTAPGGLR